MKANELEKPLFKPVTINIQLFKNETEKRYFDTFCTETAFHLAGYYSPTVWNRILTQASEAEPSIRHAIIALGALGMNARISGDDTLTVDEREADAAKHHHFALQQYSTAILEMRQSLARGGQDLRTALLCSLMIICFEIYHGQYHTAIGQVHTALQLLGTWKLKQVTPRSKPVLFSPSPDTVEDELVMVFNRLDAQTNAFRGDTGARETHFEHMEEAAKAICLMPESFGCIIEAANYGKLIMSHAVRFVALSWMYSTTERVPPVNPYTVFDRVCALPTQEGLDEQEKRLKDLDRWRSAFSSIWRHSRTANGTSWRNGSNCVEMHYTLARMGILLAFSKSELDYDAFYLEFKKMVELAAPLVDVISSTFTFDFRAVFALDSIARKCRDREIRKEAIRLLKLRPRREGFCDSVVSVAVCEWAVGVEEEDMEENGFIPEWARLSKFGAIFDWEKRSAHIWGEQKGRPGSGEQWRKRETNITW